jgi:glycosyltransferase involved in cell wall biosynthesis
MGASVMSAMINPRVTVLMPVYNAALYVAAAIDSILSQTYRDFEFLIIDDGSADQSTQIIRSHDDPRIRFHTNIQNIGVTRTLNKGLELARGEYIVRMDADDISLPTRLERQVAFMDDNPDVGACGSWVETFGESVDIVRIPVAPEDICAHLLFHNVLAHPAVCLRRQAFVENGLRYDEKYQHAEDFQLWQRASEHFPIANIAEVLLKYNIHPKSISRTKQDEQAQTLRRIDQESLGRLGISASDAELHLHRCIGNGGEELKNVSLEEVERWLRRLLVANDAKLHYSKNALCRVCGELWVHACRVQDGRITTRCLRNSLAWNLGLKKRIVLTLSYYRSILNLK